MGFELFYHQNIHLVVIEQTTQEDSGVKSKGKAREKDGHRLKREELLESKVKE